MHIGIPKERTAGERRVGLTPNGVRFLVEAEHRVYVESGAGHGAGYADETYREAGAHIVYDRYEAIGRAEVLATVGPLEFEELGFCTGEQIVFGFHSPLALSAAVLEVIRERRLNLVSYEWIEEEDGSRPVQNLMSEIAGTVATLKAAQYLMSDAGGIGLAPGFVWGVPPATFAVLGCGVAGSQAVRTAVGLGAHVVALDRDLTRLRELDRLHAGRVVTTMATGHTLNRAARAADALILAVSEPGGAPIAAPLVTREMVRAMRPRSVLVDLAVAAGGASETTRPTTPDNPCYIDEEVTHLCVPNLASLVGRSASRALSNLAVGYLLLVAAEGSQALEVHPALQRGTIFRDGVCVYPPVASAPPSGSLPHDRSRGNGGGAVRRDAARQRYREGRLS